MKAEVISIAESKRLIALEKVIATGLKTFREVGNALAEVRESRLYRFEFKSFDDYCFKKWGFSIKRASQIIVAAKVVKALPDSTIVENESQARALSQVEPSRRVEVIQEAAAVAKEAERPMTARDIREAAGPEGVAHDPGSEPVKPFTAEAIEADSESDALFQLKRWWRKATKKDQKAFLRWMKPSEKKEPKL